MTAEQLRDLADMADPEFLLIDEHTDLEAFKNTLRWKDVYYQMRGGL